MKTISLLIYSKQNAGNGTGHFSYNGVVQISGKPDVFDTLFCPFTICNGVVGPCLHRNRMEDGEREWVETFLVNKSGYAAGFESIAEKAHAIASQNDSTIQEIENGELEEIENEIQEIDCDNQWQPNKKKWKLVTQALSAKGYQPIGLD